MNQFIIIFILLIFFLSIVLILKASQQRCKLEDDEHWNEIMEHRKMLREKAYKRIAEFPTKTKVLAQRSDYHKYEKGEIVDFDNTYVFLQYFNVKFENGDIQSINYFSIKKVEQVNG